MRQAIIALLSGALFGGGLALSGMMDPSRVRRFLDIAGHWDPTLAFVMGGATLVMAVAWLVQRRMERPIADTGFSLPGTDLIDRRLTFGSALFGVGWGLAGLCPGPGIASLAVNPIPAGIFVASMFAGMTIFKAVEK